MKLSKIDLEHIILNAKDDLISLKNANLFLTGGTGYIGKWLLESFLYANKQFDLNARITLLSRNPDQFISDFPHLASDPSLSFISGDIRNFNFPEEKFNYVIHAATDVVAMNSPLETFDVILNGTKRTLDFSVLKGIKHFLFLSSGAIYGKIPDTLDFVSEDFMGRPSTEEPGSAYGIGKLASEWLGTAYAQNGYMSCKYARVFAQVGPYLPLDKQFAAGNFILNAITNDDFIIKGDGTPLRSYMYGADLAIWLWAILIRGDSCLAYNVGSDESISIKDLACKIASIAAIKSPKIKLLNNPIAGKPHDRYVPNISRAKNELSLKITIPSEEAFRRTIDWYRPFIKGSR